MPDPENNPAPQAPRYWTRWTVVWLICWAGMFAATHTPLSSGAHLPFRLADKVVHLTMYFTLAFLGARAAASRRVELTGRWFVKWAVVYAIYGAADELLQPFVGRNCSFTDWLADAIGALAALAVVFMNRPGSPEPEAQANQG